MKKYFLIAVGFCFLISCNNNAIDKPDNLIEKDKMVDIIYDLTILQAMRGNFQAKLDSNNIDVANYVYKKYKIDSLQFANSNRYYASDVASYNRMYNRVNERLVSEKAKADTLAKKQEDQIKNKLKLQEEISKTDTVKKKKMQIKLAN